ncbi:MAG TPA: hypothetical protein DEG13_07995 [Candidatus Microthrix parvicella]|uniref:hypothetical protein n=1 Tax=Candidatus Neomicrothrix TaxID=41949 RepID=UPI00037632E5|nr:MULTISPECIES: hypothetical protein [Microthrix]MBP7986588.1 hypothetical protein [Candidatus Microthrix sp.]HBX09704.1 hypothetical protein [Candidatus Microthrix parvicella]
MPLPSDDTSQPDAAPGPDPARGPDDGVQFDDVAPLDEPITLPPESDLDIRPTGAKRSDRPKIEMPVGEDAPWEQSELAPGQRRRRLLILGAVVLVFVLGAVLWAVGVGHSIGGNFEAASNRADEVNLRSAAAEVPADDYELSIDRCDTDATTGRVGVGGTLILKPGVRGGTFQVVVGFLDGEEDVTTGEASDDVALSRPGDSAPIDALGDALPGHPDAECLPLGVVRLAGPVSTSSTGPS